MNCAVCDKLIDRYAEEDYPGTRTQLNTTPAVLVGMRIQVNHPPLDDVKGRTYLQRQLGPYHIGKQYDVCYACWLRSLGVKP